MGWGTFFSGICLLFFWVSNPAVSSTYEFKIHYKGACSQSDRDSLNRFSQDACWNVHRAWYLIEHYPSNLRHLFADSPLFRLLFENESFYKTRLRNRLEKCWSGSVTYKCVGLCNTESEREAYVLYNLLGFPGWTVHFCEEFFQSSDFRKAETIAHEWGRLEGISGHDGDTRNNIYHWDNLINLLSKESTYLKVTGQTVPWL